MNNVYHESWPTIAGTNRLRSFNCICVVRIVPSLLNLCTFRRMKRKCSKAFGSCSLFGPGQFRENKLKNSAQRLISLKYFSTHFRVLCSYISPPFHFVRIVGTYESAFCKIYFMEFNDRCSRHRRLSEFINASFVM